MDVELVYMNKSIDYSPSKRVQFYISVNEVIETDFIDVNVSLFYVFTTQQLLYGCRDMGGHVISLVIKEYSVPMYRAITWVMHWMPTRPKITWQCVFIQSTQMRFLAWRWLVDLVKYNNRAAWCNTWLYIDVNDSFSIKLMTHSKAAQFGVGVGSWCSVI